MSTEQMFKKAMMNLNGTPVNGKNSNQYIIHYKGIIEYVNMPREVRNSYLIQLIEDDRRLLREAMVPFIYRKNGSNSAEDYVIDVYV